MAGDTDVAPHHEPAALQPWLLRRPSGRYRGLGHSERALRSEHEHATFFRLGPVGGEGSFWGAELGERKRMIAIDVEGKTVTFVIGSPFDDVELLWAVTEPRLQDVRFLNE